MSNSKQTTVHRSYRPEQGHMESALELLLKKSVKEAAHSAAPNEVKKGSEDDRPAR